MAFDDFIQKKREEIVAILAIHLEAKSAKTSITLEDFIRTLQARGVKNTEIKAMLFNDIKEGGRIFGEFFTGLQADVRGAMNQLAHNSKFARMGLEGKDLMVWEVDSEKPCPDCLRRSGQTDTFENWQVRGLPGSGWSVCRENCLCNLIKAEKIQEVLI